MIEHRSYAKTASRLDEIEGKTAAFFPGQKQASYRLLVDTDFAAD